MAVNQHCPVTAADQYDLEVVDDCIEDEPTAEVGPTPLVGARLRHAAHVQVPRAVHDKDVVPAPKVGVMGRVGVREL